jgi:hypothetical protein
MTNKDRVIKSLKDTELCDDCLSLASGVIPRQTVYTICRSLFESSSINRNKGKCDDCRKTKTTNRLLDRDIGKVEALVSVTPAEPSIRPWFWEGSVQSRVVNYLVRNNHTIRSVADTASRTSGKDIIALTPDGKELWISVKGYPEKSPNTQARHWFSGAIFDLIMYHGENPEVKLGIAVPDGFVTYANLLPRIRWLKESMPFLVYWVHEDGSVRVD